MGNFFCTHKEGIHLRCDYCHILPSDNICVLKIFHNGIYGGKSMCQICFLDHTSRNKIPIKL
jgi:hypothetical protein